MRSLLLLTLAAAACGGRTPAPSSPSSPAAAAPQFVLKETASDRLGTAPAGFGLPVGTEAPDATLPDVSGRTQRLADVFGKGATLVVFYRGGWCPFCNLQLHQLSEAQAEFTRRGVQLVAISVDQPGEEARTQAKHGVPFPMLSDSKLVAHGAYHVIHVPGDAERTALASFGVDLAAYSGESHGEFAVPALFLVDRQRTIRWVHVDEDYQTRPSVTQLLAIIDRTL